MEKNIEVSGALGEGVSLKAVSVKVASEGGGG